VGPELNPNYAFESLLFDFHRKHFLLWKNWNEAIKGRKSKSSGEDGLANAISGLKGKPAEKF
jgi:hypothetical protein